jgi:hypothetical protein
MPDWKRIVVGDAFRLPSRNITVAYEAILVLIDGGSIVEAYTKGGLLYDLVIRHPHADPDIFLWESRVFACENV